MDRKTFLEIDIDKLLYNYDQFINGTNKKMIVVVKANAYGLVDYEIARILIEERQVDFFAVSSLDEALRLRKHGINTKLLVMGYVHDLKKAKENDIAIIIPDYDYIDKYKNELKGIRVHLKINTGLNRLGIFPSEAKEALKDLIDAEAIVEGVMTHFACTDNEEYTNKQYNIFKETVKQLDYDFKYIHTTATDAALYLKDDICNYNRIGLGLFGFANIKHDWDLKSCVSLKAEIIACKKVDKGEGVSYGHHYICDGEGYILTAAIGYADGIDRGLENSKVYIGDEEGTIVGTVCMDLIMIKTNKPHTAGELVEIIGDHKTVEVMKDELHTCCCKVITGIEERVTRVYTKDNKVVKEIILRD